MQERQPDSAQTISGGSDESTRPFGASAAPVPGEDASSSTPSEQVRLLQAEVEALRAEVARLRDGYPEVEQPAAVSQVLRRPAGEVSTPARTRLGRLGAGTHGASWLRSLSSLRCILWRLLDPPIVPRRARPVVDWRWEAALGLLILVVAAFLRFDDLSILPTGLHGDEAIAGLEGQRILQEGWIGPYSPEALGQPSGPLYLTAVSLALFGNTIFAVRVVSAFVGALAVVVLFVLLRREIGSRAALIGAALLAVMNWHVHFSRIGFPVASWPLVVLLAALALSEAVRRGSTRWWVLAGGLASLGLYVYNAHPVVLAVCVAYAVYQCLGPASWIALAGLAVYAIAPGPLALLVLVGGLALLFASNRAQVPVNLSRLAAFAAGLIVVALPLLLYAADDQQGYLSHARGVSVLNSEEWQSLGDRGEQARFLAGRYIQFWNRLSWNPVIDGADGTGVVPPVPLPMMVLAGIGAMVAVRRFSGTMVWLGLLIVALMPISAVLTVDAAVRRTSAMAPFVAAFAAVGVVGLIDVVGHRGWLRSVLAASAALVLVFPTVAYNVDGYNRIFAASDANRWVFATELADVGTFLEGLPADRHVYFYSNRWSLRYETLRFLAPDISGEDRSTEFGTPGFEIDPEDGVPVFVFLGSYRQEVSQVASRYPGGETMTGGASDDPSFIAYLPPSPLPAAHVGAPAAEALIPRIPGCTDA